MVRETHTTHHKLIKSQIHMPLRHGPQPSQAHMEVEWGIFDTIYNTTDPLPKSAIWSYFWAYNTLLIYTRSPSSIFYERLGAPPQILHISFKIPWRIHVFMLELKLLACIRSNTTLESKFNNSFLYSMS